MAKIVLLLTVIVCVTLENSVLGAMVAKRQSCNSDDLPQECRAILSATIATAAAVDQTSFINTFCGSTCAQSLYNYFRDCDVGSDNATMFDYFCSSNAAGNRCLQLQNNSLVSACLDAFQNTTCSEGCKSALAAAYDNAGCCVFSFFAVSSSLEGARAIFTLCSDDPTTLCTGGASGATIQFPTPAVNPECEEFVDDVDESCRYLLSEDLTTTLFINPNDICGDQCGPEIYQYSRNCDEKTGSTNASNIDAFCSVNRNGQLCGQYFSGVGELSNACADIAGGSCPESCRTALQEGQMNAGCCLPTLASLLFGEQAAVFLPLISTLCGVDGFEPCASRFGPTDPPTIEGPTDARCISLRNAIPAACSLFTTSFSIALFSSSDPDRFVTQFCNSNCSKPVYDYMIECVNKTDAVNIDFLCSKSPSGTNCANIVTDTVFNTTVEGVCKDFSDRQCSQECQVAFDGLNKAYGCCLFSFAALEYNVTYTNGVWAQCGADNPGLCTGGITNAAIDAPEGEVEGSALSTTLGFTLLLILSLAAMTVIA